MPDIKTYFNNRGIMVATHVLLWVIIFYFPYLMGMDFSEGFNTRFLRTSFLIHNISMVALFYLNAYILIPIIFRRKGTLLYVISVFILFGLVLLITALTNTLFPEIRHVSLRIQGSFPPHLHHFLYVKTIASCSVFWAVSTSYRIIADNINNEKQKKDKENENIKTELSFLRSQVSPHFMFNVLNSTVSLARKKSEKVESVLIELANLMRYMLYESDEAKVLLKNEIEYLRSYIGLQMLRFSDDIKIDVALPESASTCSIEPMLLIPLVENAFKHGVGVKDAEIGIHLEETKEGVALRVSNKFNQANEGKDNGSGIGLNNLSRRLNLLYPKKHCLEIAVRDNLFIAGLKIKLK